MDYFSIYDYFRRSSSPLLLLFALAVLLRVGRVPNRRLGGGATADPDRADAHAAAALRRFGVLVELHVQAGRHLFP